MEDADSDSDIDSDSCRHHAGRDIVYGLRTNSHAVGPTEHTEDGSCAEKRKREAPGGDASLCFRDCPLWSQRAWHRVMGAKLSV